MGHHSRSDASEPAVEGREQDSLLANKHGSYSSVLSKTEQGKGAESRTAPLTLNGLSGGISFRVPFRLESGKGKA